MPALQFARRYAMAHRLLSDPSGKCAIPHGHNEIVRIRLTPRGTFRFGGANMDAPFEAVKGRWKRWIDDCVDHTFMLDRDDPLIGYFRQAEPERLSRIMTFPGDPTTEALAACYFLKLSAFVAADELPFDVAEIAIEETPTNTVILTRDRFDPDHCGMDEGSWPRRADMSINDFV